MAALDAVIFDLDGTLVDSERHGHRIAFNLAFAELGLPHRWEEDDYGRLLSVAGGKERLRHYLSGRETPQDELEELVLALHAKKNEAFLELVREGRIPARPGTNRLLDELEGRGLRLAVATTGSRRWVQPLLEGLFGLERFETIVSGDDVTRKKPDPALFHAALERLDLAPDAATAVEDSINGLRSASAAALTCIVVVNDYTRGHDLDGAHLILDGFGEPGSPAEQLGNPLDVAFDGMLTADVIIEVHSRATGSRTEGRSTNDDSPV